MQFTKPKSLSESRILRFMSMLDGSFRCEGKCGAAGRSLGTDLSNVVAFKGSLKAHVFIF